MSKMLRYILLLVYLCLLYIPNFGKTCGPTWLTSSGAPNILGGIKGDDLVVA